MTPARVFVGIVLVALVVRLGFALSLDGFLGVDGGAYLISANDVRGLDSSGVTGPGLPRPPLAPGWLLVPFLDALGPDTGYKIFSVLASLTPLLAAWLLSGLFLTPWQRVAVVGFLAVDPWQAEMLVTGALPLVGFALIMVGLWAIGRLAAPVALRGGTVWGLGRGRWATVAVLAGSVGLVPWINQTSAGLAVIYLPIYVVALVVFDGLRSKRQLPAAWFSSLCGMWPVMAGAGVALLIALPALPWYLAQAPGSDRVHYNDGLWVYPAHWLDSAWLQLFLMGLPVGVALVWKGRRPALRALGVLICCTALLAPWLSYDETIINMFYRSRYFLGGVWWVGLVWIVARYWTPLVSAGARRLALSAAMALIGLLAVISFFHQQALSEMVTDDTLAALEVGNGTATGYVTNAYTLGLWVAALERVPVSWTWTWVPPTEFTQADRDTRCILAWVAGCDVAAAAARLGVSHVLVDTKFPHTNNRVPGNYLAPPDQWQVTARAEWLSLRFHAGRTYLWEITP